MGIFLGGREKRLQPTFAERPIPPFLMGGSDGYGGNNDDGLSVPTVWACVSLIASNVSMLPLETFRRTGGVPNRITDPLVIASPAVGMTQADWMQMLMVSLLLRGNAYARIVGTDGNQRPNQLELLSPDKVRVKVDPDTGDLTYFLIPADKPLPTGSIWHMRGLMLPGSKVGLSPIAAAAAAIGVDLAARNFASDFFNGGGIPKAVVTSDQAVNQEQARTIKDRLLAATRNREPTVLGAGLKYNAISVNPEESQFIATQHANVNQICRFFNVPAGMVGGSEGGSMTYANVEQRSLDFLVTCIQPWLTRIEQNISALLPPAQYVKFNTTALLRTDAETQAKIHVQLLAGKVLTPTEVRASYELPPMTHDQKAEADLVPLTITPLGSAKALPALKAPPGAVAPVPANDNVQANSLAAAIVTVAAASHRSGSELAAAVASLADSVMLREAPSVTIGDTHIDVQPASPAEVRNEISVAPAEVRLEQPITVQPSAAPEVRLEQPITVQPSAPAEVRMVTVGAEARSRRLEYDEDGNIARIVQE